MQRALNAQPANGSGQMTVSIKSDGVSCLPSYRSREETRHTRDIQHANQERKCDVSESDEEDSCSCCWHRGRGGRGRGGRGRSKELPILDHAAVGDDVVETPTRSPSSSPQVSPTRSRSGSGESRAGLMLASQASTASKRIKYKKYNKLADDEEELVVAFLEANEMLFCLLILGPTLVSSSSNISGGIRMKFLKDAWSSLRSSTSSWSYRPNCRRLSIHGRTQNLR